MQALDDAAKFPRDAGDPARARPHLELLLRDQVQDIAASQGYVETQAEAWLEE